MHPAGREGRESPDDLASMLAGLPDGFLLLDGAWRVACANAAAARLLRRDEAELPGRPLGTLLEIGADAGFASGCAAAAADAPLRLTARTGPPERWLELHGYAAAGGVGLVLRDVTAARERHLSAAAELARQAINQRIFDTSLDLILVVDRNGDLLRVSPSVRAILGYEPEEMVGQSAARFLYHEDLAGTRSEMRMARRGREIRHFDCRYVHRDGRVVPLNWTGIWSEPEQQHFFIGRDMRERLATEERLRHAQRLEAVGKLTGGIAHDFNNLLTVVLASMELALEGEDCTPRTEALCRASLQAAQRGAELTGRLLAFARKQPLEPRLVDVNRLVGGMARLMERTLGDAVELSFLPGEGLWPVVIDPVNLEAAVANLAVNARDAMPNGGRLVIETGNAVLDDDYVRSNPDAVAGDYVVVTVSDTGTGMTPEVLQRIFEPFFTTKEEGRGTGLGLSMVFGFVKQSGGHIKAYSEAGMGTAFRLYLPRGSDGPGVEAPAQAEAVLRQGAQERILVVEDSDSIRTVMLHQLERLGYRVLEARDGPSALAVLQAGTPVDLLLTDLVMPGGMDGHVLAQTARQMRPGLKVLYASGFAGTALPMTKSPHPVLGKPYRLFDLARKVREALDG